jgi:BMFP domain-containing protein YqiC
LVLHCTHAWHRFCANLRKLAQHWGDQEPLLWSGTGSHGRGFDRLDLSFAIKTAMTSAKIIEEIGARISDAIASSPARDVDKNVRALLSSALGRLDLVPRAEFDVQAQVLLRTREKLEALTTRIAELEARLSVRDPNT